MTGLGRGGRRDQDLAELPAIGNDMVRRENGDDGVGVEGRKRAHRESDGGSVASRVRLDDEVVRRKVGQLVMNESAVLGRRDDEDALARHELRNAVDRVLEKAALAEQLEELFWSVAT
jgi:hypothetical protein